MFCAELRNNSSLSCYLRTVYLQFQSLQNTFKGKEHKKPPTIQKHCIIQGKKNTWENTYLMMPVQWIHDKILGFFFTHFYSFDAYLQNTALIVIPDFNVQYLLAALYSTGIGSACLYTTATDVGAFERK